ncbi:hypothetical protein M5K25_013704 [Dendrobium thyrsiflorum]|uniref:Transmembrane protein n=1 Tax=Dendrobium thyrsiflorum TaxID=117978 RepID=A0ABD0V0I0_DENTH
MAKTKMKTRMPRMERPPVLPPPPMIFRPVGFMGKCIFPARRVQLDEGRKGPGDIEREPGCGLGENSRFGEKKLSSIYVLCALFDWIERALFHVEWFFWFIIMVFFNGIPARKMVVCKAGKGWL